MDIILHSYEKSPHRSVQQNRCGDFPSYFLHLTSYSSTHSALLQYQVAPLFWFFSRSEREKQVVIELDYSVSKSQAFGLYRFTDLTHIVFFLNQCYESSELPHRDSVCA